MASQPNGKKLISEYYAISPKIVARINESPRRELILAEMFGEIRSIVKAIDVGKFKLALQFYSEMFARLQNTLLKRRGRK